MLFTVCCPQVGPLLDTLIYYKLVKCPTYFKEPWYGLRCKGNLINWIHQTETEGLLGSRKYLKVIAVLHHRLS